MAKLTLDDILNDVHTGKPASGADESRKYRTRSGQYIARVEGIYLRQDDKTGRRSASLRLRLLNEEGKFRGSCFTAVSWQEKLNAKGKADLKTRLYNDLVAALKAPKTAKPVKIIEAAVEEFVTVKVVETFEVRASDVPAAIREDGLKPEWRQTIFVDEETEKYVAGFLAANYESKPMVLRITEFSRTADEPEDKEIPF
jgi:hypothetical protein